MKTKYKIHGKVWLYPSEVASWHFISLNKKDSKQIKETHGKVHRGFGSLRVTATTGGMTWKTSIFPSKQGVYMLPIKASVRQAESIFNRDTIALVLKF